MKTQEFMDLSPEQQLDWIERNVEEYEVLLYGDGYILYNDGKLSTRLRFIGMIKNQLDSMTSDR